MAVKPYKTYSLGYRGRPAGFSCPHGRESSYPCHDERTQKVTKNFHVTFGFLDYFSYIVTDRGVTHLRASVLFLKKNQ